MDNSRVVFLTASALALGVVGYAVYFDYKRRNDAQFRRQLKKDKKRVDKAVAELQASLPAAQAGAGQPISQQVLREALDKIKQEKDVPENPADKEQYFMMNVGNGEVLAGQGPDNYLPAALYFYRALRVYPSPVELIMIYQKTVPEPVFQIIMSLTNLDAQERIQDYWNHFPPKVTNVAVEEKVASSTHEARRVLVATKAIRAGDVIYKENPVATALDADLQDLGTHCSHCLCKIPPGYQKVNGTYTLPTVFCSEKCALASEHANNILFSLKPSVVAQAVAVPPEDRRKAQVEYIEHLKRTENEDGEGKSSRALLAARWISRQLDEEIAKVLVDMKVLPKGSEVKRKQDDYTDSDNPGQYSLADHLERLRYFDVTIPPKERELLCAVISCAGQGFDQFITEARYALSLGKMAYNAVGVYHGQGRTDKPQAKARPEQVEYARSPVGISHQVGTAIYTLSSYLSHSCLPNAKMTFPKNDSQLHIIAQEDIEQGQEITVAYVDVTQHPEEDAAQCRQRRRVELARGWKLGCACPRCVQEGEAAGKSTVPKDDSKLEPLNPSNAATPPPPT